MFGTRKLGRTSDQRKAMLRQLTTDLLENGKIETTFYKAKEVQPVVEKMISRPPMSSRTMVHVHMMPI